MQEHMHAPAIQCYNSNSPFMQLWAQKIFPKNISSTHPSRDKYYYMEGIEGVRLPGGELREPYNWTTEELLRDFEEFLGDAFKIAHILDGSPY